MTAKATRRSDSSAMRQSLAALDHAVRAAANARRRLAKTTRPGAPNVLIAPRFRWVERLIRDHENRLMSYPDVVGFGIGRVRKNGFITSEVCVTVFVKRKLSREELARKKWKAIPKTLTGRGKRIRVDVAGVGELQRLAFAGESTGPLNDPHRQEGTIGVFARDLDTGGMCAVTAMHVSGLDVFPNLGTRPPEFVVPSRRSASTGQRLGDLEFGTQQHVDAAKIALDDPADASNTVPEFGEIQGWRPVAQPADDGLSVTMYGARSRATHGHIVHASFTLPQEHLEAVLIVDIPSQEGDSGAALLDDQNFVLGFLVGRLVQGSMAGYSVFCHAAAVVDALNCDF